MAAQRCRKVGFTIQADPADYGFRIVDTSRTAVESIYDDIEPATKFFRHDVRPGFIKIIAFRGNNFFLRGPSPGIGITVDKDAFFLHIMTSVNMYYGINVLIAFTEASPKNNKNSTLTKASTATDLDLQVGVAIF